MGSTPESQRLLAAPHRPLTISLIAAVSLVSYANLAVTAALPAIGDDLGDVALVPWVITSELVAAAIAVLGIGPIVDSRGVRMVFRIALIGFVTASLLCALAPSMLILVGARILQGVAAGGVIGSSLSSIGLAFPESLRPRAYAMVSAVWGVMGIGGPTIAAVLISAFGWRSVFTVAVPIGLTAAAIGWNRLPGPREDGEATDFDRRGLAIVAVVTVALLMATSDGSLWALLWLTGAIAVGALYLRHSRSIRNPVVRLGHLTGRRWRYLHITSTLAVAGGTGASSYLPLYLRGARGASEGEAAFSVLFLVIGWSTAAYLASRLQERMHAAHIVRGGSAALITATATATLLAGFESHPAWLLAAFFFVGSGIGSITTAGLTILQARAAPAEMGRVSSSHQFVRSLGFAYGAAVGGAVLFLVVSLQIGDVEAIRELLGGEDVTLDPAAVAALQDGYVWALAITGVFSAITAASAQKLVRNIGKFERPEQAARVATHEPRSAPS